MSQRAIRFTSGFALAAVVSCGTYAVRRATADDTPSSASSYHLQVGDEMQIQVLGMPELSTTTTIRPDGMISVMLVDDLRASDRTVPDIRQDLTDRYSKLYHNPRVGVFVKTFSNRTVYVTGEVAKPGSMPLNGALTVVQAATMAGGFLPSAKLEEAVLLRQSDGMNRKVIPVELPKILKGDAQDIPLQPSDVVYIPKSDIKVFVGGEVQKPGLIPLDRQLSALKALTAAGGLLDSGSLRGAVLIRDHGNQKPETIPLHLDEVMRGSLNDTILQPYDIVYVPRSNIAKLDRAVDQYIRRVIPMTLTGGFSYLLGGNISSQPCFQ